MQKTDYAEKTALNCAGRHLIIEFWGARNLNSVEEIKKALISAVKRSGATLLGVECHKFSPQGVSGLALISESHLSVHTWPERKYAALDIFTCGQKVDPYKAMDSLKSFFKPEQIQVMEIKRGIF